MIVMNLYPSLGLYPRPLPLMILTDTWPLPPYLPKSLPPYLPLPLLFPVSFTLLISTDPG